MAALSAAGAVLGLIALFLYLIPAFTRFKDVDQVRFGAPAQMLSIGYTIGYILLLLGFISIILAAITKAIPLILATMVIIVIGGLLLLIGVIGLIIGTFRLKDMIHDSLFTVAGILLIIGIFISYVTFVAWIIIFIASTQAMSKLTQTYANTAVYS
ncbi:MAG: DUF973 family protein [Desulfurococcales archaeon]|nr:DUF973 family protein [Desulfurococcales archaeon]